MPPSLNQQAYRAVRSFLSTYVAPNGRVIRRDQGGDTVSEGQAYGMLLAVAMDDRSRFDSIWGWTRTNLLQPDGLLASSWSGGRVTSTKPATDADLDAAQALVLANERFGGSSYRRQGVALARAILDNETASTASSKLPLVLPAGTWARNPIVSNPSYFSPRAYADLAQADRDQRWRWLVTSSRAIVSQLAAGGRALPPDWATVGLAVATGSSAASGSSRTDGVDPGRARAHRRSGQPDPRPRRPPRRSTRSESRSGTRRAATRPTADWRRPCGRSTGSIRAATLTRSAVRPRRHIFML